MMMELETTKMETESCQLLAKINALEQSVNDLLQQQKHQEEWKSRLKELESRCFVCSRKDHENHRFQDCEHKNDNTDPCGKDVLHLNVGGSKQIAVLRSTLTFVEGSMLAARFSGRWDDGLEKDRDGNVFIDQPPDLFIPMIDFLQCKTKETLQHLNVSFPTVDDFGGSFDRFKKFANMVEFYGMTTAVLPPPLRLLYSSSPGDGRISGHYVAAPPHITMFVHLVTRPWEQRRIQSFEVTIEVAGNVGVGWARDCTAQNFSLSVAESASIRYGCEDNVVRYQYSESVPHLRNTLDRCHKMETALRVREGCVIRSERRGSNFTWTIDGKTFAHDPRAHLHDCATYVPSISGGGKWWISNFEYEEMSP
jgi:hypothetical protein